MKHSPPHDEPVRSVRPPAPITSGAPSTDALTLMAALDWSRDKIERLCRYSSDEYTVSNLRSIAAAMDPARNPKLESVYERNGKAGHHG